jgi:Ca-activated chloride channel homolog
MNPESNKDAETLYRSAMQYFRQGQWVQALEAFKQLQTINDNHPEVEHLIADIQLKLELERLHIPASQKKPQRTYWPFVLAGVVTVLLLIGAGVMVSGIASQPTVSPASQASAREVSLPTAAPTSTPRPSPTPIPTLTPEPTATLEPTSVPLAEPTAIPEPGLLIVKTADGEQLTRTTGNIIFIIDASGSMLAVTEQGRKIDVAREALRILVEKLPQTTKVGLSTYGIQRAKGCDDFQMLAPLGTLDNAAMLQLIDSVEPAPRSLTPIGFSLQRVADSLKDVQADTMIVLISDGEETCNADPAAVAAKIHADSPQIRIAVIGFSIGTDELRTRLSSIAESGNGPYFDAGNAPQLVNALQQAIAINYRVSDAKGNMIYSGALGSQIALDPGTYQVIIGDKNALAITVTVDAAQQSIIQIRERDGNIEADIVTP